MLIYESSKNITCTAVIRGEIMQEIDWTNGGPNASLRSLRSGRAAFKHVVMLSIRISVRVG
jgi:hypothetical protein